MGEIFTAFMGGVQHAFLEVPVALLWNRDATKVLRIRRVLAFAASPQYRDWIGAVQSFYDLQVYGVEFNVIGHFERVALAHDQAALPLGDIVCASGQGVNLSTTSSILITGTGQTVRRAWHTRYNPAGTLFSSYTHGALCSCPYYGEIYNAGDLPDVQPLTLRCGEALVLWDRSGALASASYRIPSNVVIEFEQDHV